MADPRYDLAALLARTAELSARYLAALPDRHVGPREDAHVLTERLRVPFPDGPDDPLAVIERMAEQVDRGLVASAGPRYFGFIVGGRASGVDRGRLAHGGVGPKRGAFPSCRRPQQPPKTSRAPG